MSNTFVMVPVPEELVHDVVHFVAKLNMQGGPGGSLRPWDAAAMEKYFLEAHEETRTLLSVIARGSLAGKRVTDQAAADFMQLGAPEMLEVIRGIRESLRQERRVQLIEVEVVSEPLPSGRLREKRLLKMPPELARWFAPPSAPCRRWSRIHSNSLAPPPSRRSAPAAQGRGRSRARRTNTRTRSEAA